MRPFAERWFEGCSKKRPYSNELLAHRVASNAFKERGVELRVYKCEFCPLWHVTKQLVMKQPAVNQTNDKEMNV